MKVGAFCILCIKVLLVGNNSMGCISAWNNVQVFPRLSTIFGLIPFTPFLTHLLYAILSIDNYKALVSNLGIVIFSGRGYRVEVTFKIVRQC